MPAPTNTATTLSQRGNREDLTEILERVAPEETPFSSACDNVTATAVYHEWQTETLRTPSSTNAVLEGDDTDTYAENVSTRVGNYTQIGKEAFVVSGTQEAVRKAGRKSEINRQRLIVSKQIKRDFEARFLSNTISRQQSGSDARLCAGVLGWITSNVSRGAGGSNGSFTSGAIVAATNGTQRAFAESQVQTVMQSVFTSSGTAKQRDIYMSAFNKRAFSAFAGIAELRRDVPGMKQATVVGAADMYMSDFGLLAAKPVAYGLTRDVLIADHDYLKIATLRGMTEEKLAKTGDNEKRHILAEKTLVVTNQAALGVVADLTTS
ncbi:Family of unknown function (DUF5309) [uncultured Caudovirales phage]|uniref:Head protein n=1 Tax=uncultured Caudovirales phage TaxID=2100421 RepID=A0A6J5M744_9CAUD|nr:Family of unknown function (DUF5309) [uncultured Caudovirales phage]